MKKGLYIFIIFMLILLLTGCKSNNSVTKGEETMKQNVEVIEVDENGEIIKGTIEGYTFTETEEESNRIKIQMEDGNVILAVLSNSETPITIANFKKLVGKHYYDGVIFHRVIKDFMIQCGEYTGTDIKESVEKIKGEFAANGVANSMSHERGVLSMARSSIMDSASAQFFIVHKTKTYLDGQYASFGKVFAGMDEVDKIADTETGNNDRPIEEQKIKSIRFITVE